MSSNPYKMQVPDPNEYKVVLSLNFGEMKIFKNKLLIIIYLMQASTSEKKKKILLSRGLQFIIGLRLVFFFFSIIKHT